MAERIKLGANKRTKEEKKANMQQVLNQNPLTKEEAVPKKVIVDEGSTHVEVSTTQPAESIPKKVIVQPSPEKATSVATEKNSEINSIEPVKKKETRGRPRKNFTEEDIEKARVTHFLSKQILGELEDMYDEIRKQLPYDKKAKIKKSHIVDLALQTLITDFNKKGENSIIMKKLFNKV